MILISDLNLKIGLAVFLILHQFMSPIASEGSSVHCRQYPFKQASCTSTASAIIGCISLIPWSDSLSVGPAPLLFSGLVFLPSRTGLKYAALNNDAQSDPS
ncbi:uncharacterized protein ZBAI_08642 [Zygosaccharomyces bailii ISA1307]|nr:uncharacterized protein ZBAI_08642 [Zygosaccharomyces bailii ISA1307]